MVARSGPDNGRHGAASDAKGRPQPRGSRVGPISLSIPAGTLGLLLAWFAGLFLAVGAGHLLPEAQHQRPAGAPLFVVLAAVGAAVALAIRSVAL